MACLPRLPARFCKVDVPGTWSRFAPRATWRSLKEDRSLLLPPPPRLERGGGALAAPALDRGGASTAEPHQRRGAFSLLSARCRRSPYYHFIIAIIIKVLLKQLGLLSSDCQLPRFPPSLPPPRAPPILWIPCASSIAREQEGGEASVSQSASASLGLPNSSWRRRRRRRGARLEWTFSFPLRISYRLCSRQKAGRRKPTRGERAQRSPRRGQQERGAAPQRRWTGQGLCMSRPGLGTGLAAVNELLPLPPPPPAAAAPARFGSRLPLPGRLGSILRISPPWHRLFFRGDLLVAPRLPGTFLFVCVL